MNRLPPSLREKQRYLCFKIHSETPVELGDVVNAVWDSALGFLGSKGCSEADFWIIGNKFDEDTQKGVMRVNTARESDLRAALALINELGGEKGFLEVKKVSGTITSLEE